LGLQKIKNIYVLFYDGYPNKFVLDKVGFDNKKIRKLLIDNGFKLYDDIYSQCWKTTQSMSAFFDVDKTANETPRAILTGSNPALRFLRQRGYKTHYFLNGYLLSGSGRPLEGDYYFPQPAKNIRIEDVLWHNIKKGFFSQAPTSFSSCTAAEWVKTKQDLLRTAPRGPFFMYAHSGRPGHTVWNPNFREENSIEVKKFIEKLKIANEEIEKDILLLKEQKDAIIIVAGDHGAYLLADSTDCDEKGLNALHLLDRYGTMLAIKWPEDYRSSIDLNILQDVFLEVMIYLTEEEGLTRFKCDGETKVQGSFSVIPPGAIKNSLIQVGVDKGQNLFEASNSRLLGKDGQ
ncbi:MAG: hypothetical protein PHV28_15965, partial [Kiritimatiellae bacterium]|nr:hypothetical protein [Kiritimatiellia bacterium]